jgi:hypothetical protein
VPQTNDRATPYLTVVVTLSHENGDGGTSDPADPIERLQLFVSGFDEQCRQTGLDAEVIVVEWNRPPWQAGAAARVRLPNPSFCTYRFIDVPPDVHSRLRYSNVLAAFPMIARNVGVRRARGRFILATSVDAMFSTELIAHLASRSLEPDRLYRVDRRDVDPDVPRDGPLEAKLAYCATHQRRVHGRAGTYPVDPNGSMTCGEDDIVDGHVLRLGEGWHVREGGGRTSVYRWARDRAEVVLETAVIRTTEPVLEIDVEANPYDPRAWVKLEVLEGVHAMSRTHVTGRMQLHVPLERRDGRGPRRIELRVSGTHAKPRFRLPIFERRDSLSYRVYSVRLRPEASDGSMVDYPLSGWTSANPSSAQTETPTEEGLVVATDSPKWSYSMHYGLLRAPANGTYRFELTASFLEGRMLVGVLNGSRNRWLPASVAVEREASRTRFAISADLGWHEPFWLMVYNDHPDGVGVSRFILRRMTGSIEPSHLAVAHVSNPRFDARIGRALSRAGRMTARVRRLFARPLSSRAWRFRAAAFADSLARTIVARVPDGVRTDVVHAAPEYRRVDRAFHIAVEEAKAIAPLRELAGLHKFLRDHRPDDLHVNGCGDFQLMARENWHSLRGYPELEAFSDNVDSLLSFMADAAGIKEQALAMAMYQPQRDVPSRPSADDEDESMLRRRMAERSVPRLDADTVSVWASQMRWLQRPIMFNDVDWGLGSLELPECSTLAAVRSTT